MKKIFFVLLAFIIGSFMIGCNSNHDPYAGEYKTTDNTILELNSDGTCKVINNFYKDVFYTYGKYSINDNKIKIIFEKDKQNYLRVESLKGEVKGSNIELNNYPVEGKEWTYFKIG